MHFVNDDLDEPRRMLEYKWRNLIQNDFKNDLN